jgi:type I restriction enzyme S subunit
VTADVGWPIVPLKDASEHITVGFVGSQADLFVDDGVPLLRGQNIKPFRLDLTNLKYVPDEVHAKWKKSALEAGDVVIVRVGYPGVACVIPAGLGPLNAASLVIVRPDGAILRSQYLALVLNSPWGKERVQELLVGSAQQVLNTQSVAELRVPIPPTAYQDAALAVFGAVDALIENSQRRIALLEQMAQAIYREWFVHFRYPGHQDDALVDSPLGPIPESWDVRPVQEVAKIIRGRSYRGIELVEEGGVPFINLKCMERGGGFRRDGLKRYAGPFKPEQITKQGDIVLAVTDLTQAREILARATLVPRMAEVEGVISLDVARVVANSADDRIPLFALLRYSDLADRVKEFANGSTVLHLSPDHIGAADIIWPSEKVRRIMNDTLGASYEMADELSDAVDRLTNLRDLLLPGLVSGAIDVSRLDLEGLFEESLT